MNCTELDGAVGDVRDFFTVTDEGFAIAAGALALLSGVLLFLGARLVRPVAAVVAGLAATGVVFVLSELVAGIPCLARVAVAATAGVLAAVLALCLFKTGLFVLGAAGFGTVGHFVYDALPLEGVPPPFVLLGRSGYYYLVLLGAAAVGAIASCWQRAHFVRISSALLGGGGVAWTVHLVADRATGEANAVPSLALLAVLLGSTALGVCAQYRLGRRRDARRDGGAELRV